MGSAQVTAVITKYACIVRANAQLETLQVATVQILVVYLQNQESIA